MSYLPRWGRGWRLWVRIPCQEGGGGTRGQVGDTWTDAWVGTGGLARCSQSLKFGGNRKWQIGESLSLGNMLYVCTPLLRGYTRHPLEPSFLAFFFSFSISIALLIITEVHLFVTIPKFQPKTKQNKNENPFLIHL